MTRASKKKRSVAAHLPQNVTAPALSADLVRLLARPRATLASSHPGIRLALSNGQDRRTATANCCYGEADPKRGFEVSDLGGDKEADDATSACSALNDPAADMRVMGNSLNQQPHHGPRTE